MERLNRLPTEMYRDLPAMGKNMALIDANVLFELGHVLPGHDSRVFKRSCYPSDQ